MDSVWSYAAPLLKSPTAWTTAAAFATLGYCAFQYSTLAGPRRRPAGPSGNQLLPFRDAALSGNGHKFITDMAAQYGDFFCFKVIDGWNYVITDAAVVREALTNNKQYVRLHGWIRATNSIGPMLFGIEGPIWKSHRKIISPAFTPTHLRNALQEMLQLTDRMCKQLNAAIDASSEPWSASVDVHNMFSRIALDLFATAFLGNDVNVLGGQTQMLLDAADGVVKGINSRFPFPTWLWPVLFKDNFKESVSVLRDLVNGMIEQKQLNGARSEQHKDMLDILLQASQENEETMPVEHLASEMLGFLLAGFETTANTMTFALKALCDHPQEAAKLRREIEQVVGNAPLTTDVISRLKLLDLFLKETLRYYPILELNSRTVVQDTTIHGYTIPKGATLQVAASLLHFSPKYWRDPHTFDPSRFETDTIVPGSYIPFGDGPHRCIGERLAVLEMKTILIKLLQHYDFKLVSDQSFRLVYSVTLGYKEGLFVQFKRRSS
ncbi:hypothetical protein RI367_007006 [Sorochytrium milnesiophthora]